ncbi:hypothetical protein O181_025161 [Austropuccinia psidii MF-1]|uniref:DNA helicase n=1 Tax=Austropuccinia psidii MF-1 TaxID=1389203 RepID=A0A9Q3CI10_9BASI|nr:hypothetical protein [Austropuccinia psidii MF-1]
MARRHIRGCRCSRILLRFSLDSAGGENFLRPAQWIKNASMTSSAKDLNTWLEAHLRLLRLERASEKEEFDLLTSEKVKRGQTKLLEQMGISIGALGVRNTNVGLGGKTIIELERPAQYHTDPKLPYHALRSGVPVGIIDHDIGSSKLGKKKLDSSQFQIFEGVVSKVNDLSLSVTIRSKDDSSQLELPARCRVIKLADMATFDRLEQIMERLGDSLVAAGLCAPAAERSKQATEPNQSSKQNTNQTNSGEPQTSGRKPQFDLTDLIRVLLGIDHLKLDQEEIERISLPPCALHLNASQQYAVKHALSSCPITLIFGPPGTGKTHTLVSIIAALHARGDRVIVTAASNLAIDNIAERLLDLKLPLTRLGHPARVLDSLSHSTLEHQLNTSDEAEIIQDLKKEINQNLAKLSAQGKSKLRGRDRATLYKDVQELRKDYRQRERGHTQNIIKTAKIICATTHGAGSRQLEHEKFDVIIVDESTQAFEAACWIPIVKAKSKLILAGDPLQLPPTVKSKKKSSGKAQKGKKLPNKSQGKDKEKTSDNSKKPGKSSEVKEKQRTPANGQKPTKDSDSQNKNKEEKDQLEKTLTDDPRKEIASPEAEKASANSDSDESTTQLFVEAPNRPVLKRPRSLETTMFDRILRSYPQVSCLLNLQYRMHQAIMKFPADELYESKLTASPSVSSHLLKDLPNVAREDIDGVADPVLFVDTSGCYMFDRDAEEGGDGSIMNENEADLVVERVSSLVEAGLLPEQILVISPYSAQVSLLNSLLKTQYPTLAVGSIDSCQGRENEAVIISLCRSNPEGVVGFLGEKRRLNVAMTRAKRHLTVIGDSDTLSKGGIFLKNWMNWLENNAEVRSPGV